MVITTIQMNFVPIDQAAPNSPELVLLKFLPLTYHHIHFLAATLDFTSFPTIALLRAAHFFLQLGCFGLDKSHPKTAYSCKKSVRPSKAELTATKSNDIKMRPCARCASCKINIS